MGSVINRTKAMLGMSPNTSKKQKEAMRGRGRLHDQGALPASDPITQLNRRRLSNRLAGQTGGDRFATILGEYVRQRLGESGG